MKILLVIVFYLSLLSIFYVFFGYPVLLAIMGFIKPNKVRKESYFPSVTIIISAYNEEIAIGKNLENKIELEYPTSKLEIIVVSDGSTDNTDHIVKTYESRGVKLIRQEPRSGKTCALNLAVSQANGEVIVFSDANSMYDPNALQMLVRNFSSQNIGYVTGKMIYSYSDGSTTGEGCSAYMKYENMLRELETRIGSVVGVDGGIDAIRKVLYIDMRADQLPDFVLPLKVIEQGYRVVYEPSALLKEEALSESKDEYHMRVRVALRALWAIADMRQLLSVKRYGFFAVQLWSHKLLRYSCFIFLLAAYITNIWLWPHGPIFKIFFILQNLAYIGALCAPIMQWKGIAPGPLKYLTYFVLINSASAHAFIKFLLRKKQVVWKPRKG